MTEMAGLRVHGDVTPCPSIGDPRCARMTEEKATLQRPLHPCPLSPTPLAAPLHPYAVIQSLRKQAKNPPVGSSAVTTTHRPCVGDSTGFAL